MLQSLLEDTKTEKECSDTNITWCNALLSVLRKNHYWPAIQVKKFCNNSNMVLLHNTYRRKDIDEFKELYDECRSVVLDFSQIDNDCIVCKANSIPIRILDDEYMKTKSESDVCEEAYDSTMIFVYYNDDCWHFGTTSCPSVDYSKFVHPTKKYGMMLNETLSDLFPNVEDVRKALTDVLNKEIVYEFALIHYDNSKYIDYTSMYGPKYKKLMLIRAKTKGIDSTSVNVEGMEEFGILKPMSFQNPDDAIAHIHTSDNSFGIIVYRNNNIYKVSIDKVIFQEDTDPGNPNPWRNMLWVYQQNRDDYHINDYIKTYMPNLEYPIDGSGQQLDPTYLIHTAISTIKDILYNLYVTTTSYYPKHNRFKMSKDIDKKLPPILQFHLAQLRHKQITLYKDTKNMITINAVFSYLCHNNSVKNIVSLINFFATNTGYDIPPRASMCFSVLNNLLIS